MKIELFAIRWDTESDGAHDSPDLPERLLVTIPDDAGDIEAAAINAASDETGWLIHSCEIRTAD